MFGFGVGGSYSDGEGPIIEVIIETPIKNGEGPITEIIIRNFTPN